MSELWPLFAVVAVWVVVFLGSVLAFARWLKVPTEMEIEHEHEAAATEHASVVH